MFVAMCHCRACQRRTGSSYNLGAWYELSRVEISGEGNVFSRSGESGMQLSYHFCPECGSNLYWEASAVEDAIGIAGGCFADPAFPQPSFSIFGESRHEWVQVPEGTPCYLENYPSQG